MSMVHDYTQHGDPLIQQFIHHMLERISAPFYVMLQRWIYEGELEDPRTEFFIAVNPDVEEEDMWQSKYFIREEMLPAFIGMPLAKKVPMDMLLSDIQSMEHFSMCFDLIYPRNHNSLPTLFSVNNRSFL